MNLDIFEILIKKQTLLSSSTLFHFTFLLENVGQYYVLIFNLVMEKAAKLCLVSVRGALGRGI